MGWQPVRQTWWQISAIRIQRLATRLLTGILSLTLWRETAVAGSSFLAAATASGWPDYRIQDIHGSFGCWSPPNRRGFRGHPYKLLQGTSHRRRRGSVFRWELWNTQINSQHSIVTAHSACIPPIQSFRIAIICTYLPNVSRARHGPYEITSFIHFAPCCQF